MAYQNKDKTLTSIIELKLITNKQQEKEILKISDCARQHNNAVLGESLKRLEKLRKDPMFKEALNMPKSNNEEKKLRNEAFKYLDKKYGFTKEDIEKWGTKSKNNSKFINKHVGTHVLQKISNRAFESVNKLSFGKSKKVNFKRKGEFICLESKNNKTFITYSNGFITLGKMIIKCKLRKNDKVLEHFLKHRIKFCKIVSKKINDKDKFFVQISYEGLSYQKVKLGTLNTALDIGPSTIAIVNEKQAILKKFCDNIPNKAKEINKMKRKNSRKLRLLNPQNYDNTGVIKKGSKIWVKSKGYKTLQNKITDMEYRLTCRRKQEHGLLANNIVSMSKKVSSEKLSYKAFQKMYGKSIGKSAPSMFINILKNKLILYGGEFVDIVTQTTKLSQTCICGKIKKKSLNMRFHKCSCGVCMQRDLFSAYLALWVKNNDKLDIKESNLNYKIYEPILNKCIENLKLLKKTNPEKIISTFGI